VGCGVWGVGCREYWDAHTKYREGEECIYVGRNPTPTTLSYSQGGQTLYSSSHLANLTFFRGIKSLLEAGMDSAVKTSAPLTNGVLTEGGGVRVFTILKLERVNKLFNDLSHNECLFEQRTSETRLNLRSLIRSPSNLFFIL